MHAITLRLLRAIPLRPLRAIITELRAIKFSNFAQVNSLALETLIANHSESKHYLQNIRKSNSCFQMASFVELGADKVISEYGFMPTIKV